MWTWESIITILAVIGSALTIYFNLKKFGDNIKQETAWRTGVNSDMRNLLDRVTDLLNEHKETTTIVRDLIDFKISQSHVNAAVDKEFAAIRTHINEIKDTLKNTKKV